jgi:hypothetical protein
MRKPRQTQMDFIPTQRPATKPLLPSRRTMSSRRRLLLVDYQTWLAATADVADVASRNPET